MAIAIPKAGGIIATHGTWSKDKNGAWLGCPKPNADDGCQTYSHIESASIAANGDVTPSWACPNCDYDQLITLTDWEA